MQFSDEIEKYIHDAYYKQTDESENPFEELLSMGELVDRLSIVNNKLYKLKDDVMNSEDSDFKSWAAEQDVKLVLERARLKKCVDEKLVAIIHRIKNGYESGGYNPEVKKYGGA
jgi:hypothetical protein